MSKIKIGSFIVLLIVSQFLNGQKKEIFVDNRDGHSYRYIQIGQQYWMAENLAYLPKVSPPSAGVKIDEKNIEYCYVSIR